MENYKKYNSDKANNYMAKYEDIFSHLRNSKLNLLELGVYKGGSLNIWADFFPNHKNIVGIDLNMPLNFISNSVKISIRVGSQISKIFLSKIKKEFTYFDIIIDDASHFGEFTKFSFYELFDSLKSGGYYVIEDWGTGYWSEYYDGHKLDINSYKPQPFQLTKIYLKAIKFLNKFGIAFAMKGHNYGMVGFMKQLIDEQGANDNTINNVNKRGSKFSSIQFFESIVVIKKL